MPLTLRRLLLAALTFAALALVLAVAPEAGASPFPALPAPTYKTVSRDVAIRMDDGVELAATITFPSLDGSTQAPGRFPVVFSMTPYGRHGVCGCADQTVLPSRGIISAVVDTRGTGGSEGNLDGNYFSPREQRDGYELTEWFGTQPWSTGKVGMWGGSYLGITQYLTAEQQPPHLAAIVPQVALADLYRDAYTHGGIPNIFFDGQYIAVQGGPGATGVNTDPTQLPLTVKAKLDQAQSRPIAFDYLARPNDDAFYRDRSPIYRANQIKVPVLILDGWRNGFIRGDVEMYRALARRPGVETRLYVDPCTHKGCGAPFDPTFSPTNLDDLTAMSYEFLSHYLRGTPEPPRAPVRFYVQGADRYAQAAQWPPRATRFLRFYLDRGTIARRRSRRTTSQSYATNPAAGFSMSFDEYGTIAGTPYVPTDQRLEDGNGITWRTPALRHALTLAGPTQLHLVAASTAPDTDWVAKLADVAPDGSETIISEGYLRASHRALDRARSSVGSPYHTDTNPTPIVPGRLYDYDLGIWPTGYELAAGHRLQLRLTTDDLPTHLPGSIQFDANDPAATQFVPLDPAVNSVHEGGRDPSWLLVPAYGG